MSQHVNELFIHYCYRWADLYPQALRSTMRSHLLHIQIMIILCRVQVEVLHVICNIIFNPVLQLHQKFQNFPGFKDVIVSPLK